jgi:hypothetical protein
MYAAMALPGSELYKKAIDEGKVLPQTYSGYSFHSRDTLPLGTVNVTPSEALKFRDEAFLDYHLNPNFLTRIERNFGENAVLAIRSICDTKLVRDIYS